MDNQKHTRKFNPRVSGSNCVELWRSRLPPGKTLQRMVRPTTGDHNFVDFLKQKPGPSNEPEEKNKRSVRGGVNHNKFGKTIRRVTYKSHLGKEKRQL